MSSCLSGYGVELEIIKSPSPATSSSSNSRLAICTRRPRTARKRPNQTYNEAAALLSTAYPTIFSTKHLTKKPHNFTQHSFFDQSSELLLLDTPAFLHHPSSRFDPKPSACHDKPCLSPPEIAQNSEDDFDTESILDEEMEEGIIDSIMGISPEAETPPIGPWHGFGGKLDFGFGVRRGVRPLRHPDDGNWCTVDVLQISPRLTNTNSSSSPVDNKKKPAAHSLLLKLNYDDVLKAWSGRGPPLPEDLAASESPDIDVSARLAQIDLFTDGGGLREASVMRYKEKRRTRLFSKKIRYQVRKVNADRRPRMKGRFVRRSNSGQRG